MWFQTALSLVGLLLLATGGQHVSALEAAESCHLREFDLCLTSAIVFVQQPQGSKLNEAEIEKQCGLFKETEDCLQTYTDRCMSQLQNSLVDFMSGGILRFMREYCKKGSDTRKNYLKYGDCVNKQRKNTNKCLVDFQAAVEKATQNETVWQDRPKVICCALNRMRDCNAKILEPACGKESVELSDIFVRATFSRGAYLTCTKYVPDSEQCKNQLPALGTKPKGAKSSSVLSKLISTVTQV